MSEESWKFDEDLLYVLKEARSHAKEHLTQARRGNATAGFLASFRKIEVNRLKQIEETLCYTDTGSEQEVELLTRLLGVWLTWYFAGVPAVRLWQQISERLRRDVALPTIAFKMKAYGDVYRIERRRFAEREKLVGSEKSAEEALETLEGIVTIVDHSTLTHADEELQLLDQRIALKDEVKPDASSQVKNRILDSYLHSSTRSPAQTSFCVNALVEILARHYCSCQILRYVKAGLRIELFLILQDDSDVETVRIFIEESLDKTAEHQVAFWYSEHDDLVKGIPIGVLGTHTGVVREDGQWLGSPVGRKFDTRRLTSLSKLVRKLPKSTENQLFP